MSKILLRGYCVVNTSFRGRYNNVLLDFADKPIMKWYDVSMLVVTIVRSRFYKR